MGLKVLYIGGTGTISAACVRESLALGHEVSVLNRGQSTLRPLPPDVRLLRADIADDDATSAALTSDTFDVVADFLTYEPTRLARNIACLRGRVRQYVLIATASAYAKPVPRLPITESMQLVNPYWEYSREKIACEDLLVGLIRSEGFPGTIVRPSHTYDAGKLPNIGKWTDIARMREGKPIVILGDGTSLWTLTHARDFAYCFARLLGDRRAIGEAFHITGDEVLTWNAIYAELARAAGVAEPVIVHATSQAIARVLPVRGPGLLGDKSHSVIFDNSKVRSIATGFAQRVPFSVGAEEIIACHDAHPEIQFREPDVDAAWDLLAARDAR
ncbi:MAG: NAD-dependent epimerase/dehydratase family protein [Micrococcales bacterium]|nr:NAD-dependent epimerase/dehydratase family protein [Micrococcales bacterium]